MYSKSIFILLFCFATASYGQSNCTFSKSEQREDYDTLMNTILKVSPHWRIKKDLWGYDAAEAMKKLRLNLDTVSSDQSFYLLLRQCLDLAQDDHTSLWGNQEEWARTQAEKYQQFRKTFKLSIPNAYVDGQYRIREPFQIGKDTIKIGTIMTRIDGQPIEKYLRQQMGSNIFQYDLEHRRFYYAGFFRNFTTLFSDSLSITFQTAKQQSKTYRLSTRNFTKYFPVVGPKQVDSTRVELWEPEGILYIRLTEMHPDYLPYLTAEIAKYRTMAGSIKKTILDFRNNGGGSDYVWQSVYAELIADTIAYDLKIDAAFDGLMTSEKIETKGKIDSATFRREESLLLKKYSLATVVDEKEILEPSPTSLKLKSKIYVLAEDHYSSTGSAVAVANAKRNDQLIAVGRKTGMFLGIGFAPKVFTLPHTKLTFRVAPSLEVTRARTLSDLMFDETEIEVPFDLKEWQVRNNYLGDKHSKDFLLRHDSFIRAVLNHGRPKTKR